MSQFGGFMLFPLPTWGVVVHCCSLGRGEGVRKMWDFFGRVRHVGNVG